MQNKRDGQPQSVYLKSAHREMAKQLGNGNVSDGIRTGLEAASEKEKFIAHLHDEAEKSELRANDFNGDSYQCGFWEGYAKALQKTADSLFDGTGSIDVEAGDD